MLHRNSGLMYWLWGYQIAGIMLEDVVMALGSAIGLKDSRKCGLYGLRTLECRKSLTNNSALMRNIGRVWLALWMSSLFAGVTASNLFLSAGHANDQHPFGFSMISWIRYADGCDNIWAILADRWIVCTIMCRALYVFSIRSVREVFPVLPSLAVLAALFWATSIGDNNLDVVIKFLGLVWALLDLFVHGP